MKKISKKQAERNKTKSEDALRLHELFREIWDEREDESGYCYCYETNVPLYGPLYRSNTACYHHLLPKSKYPELAYDKRNIVILHPDIHANIENKVDGYPKVRMKEELVREELLKEGKEYGDSPVIKDGILE